MAYLNNLERFYGTGEKNRAGQTLEEFLASYNPKKYDAPCNTTDIVVVRCREKLERWGQPIQVLMVKRSNHPSIGFWALPGGFVELREDLQKGAARELEEETGISGLPLEQMHTWGDCDRDPRWRVITTSFLALAEGDLAARAGDDAADALWMDVELKKTGTESGAELWQLELSNEEKGVRAGAAVRVTRSGSRLLPGETWSVTESRKIAVDHGAILVQALLCLKGRLEKISETPRG